MFAFKIFIKFLKKHYLNPLWIKAQCSTVGNFTCTVISLCSQMFETEILYWNLVGKGKVHSVLLQAVWTSAFPNIGVGKEISFPQLIPLHQTH